jgi:hypothetical protein
MITVLVVGAEGKVSTLEAGSPSVEILHSRTVEDALERLARNRRIDAVLLLAETDAESLVRTLQREDPAGPPLFVPASAGRLAGARTLASDDAKKLISLLAEELAGL